jgi:hypothetical protein
VPLPHRAAIVLSALGVLGVPAGAAAKAPSRAQQCKQVTTILGAGSEAIPAELPGAPEAAVLDQYALLRRQAATSDALPPLNLAGSQLQGRLASYYPASIRQIASMPNGARWFLIPGFLHVAEVPPAACLPSALRKQRSTLVQREQARRTQPAYCLVEVGGSEAGSEGECGLFSEVGDSTSVFASGFSEQAVAGLVPDGVASVRVSYRHVPPVLLSVSEDGYVLNTPAAVQAEQHRLEKQVERRLAPQLKSKHLDKKRALKLFARILKAVVTISTETAPTKVEWLGSTGAVLRTTPRPRQIVGPLESSSTAGGLLAATSELAIRTAR